VTLSRRTERIAEQLRDEIARILRREVEDPRVHLVTLTRIDVSPDLANATVHWSTLDDAEAGRQAVEDGLESAAGFVRRRLAAVLPLRRVPALHFRYDPSMVLAQQTLDVLNELRDDETP
jgi:ribosome-binding factor A